MQVESKLSGFTLKRETYRLVRSPKISSVVCKDDLDLNWQGEFWRDVAEINIDSFLPESSSHRPLTRLKMQYDEHGIYGIFLAEDQFVRCTQTEFQSLVCRDSCVEVYFQPAPHAVPEGYMHASYLNLEISGNGTLLSYCISDSRRAEDGFKAFCKLSKEDGDRILIKSTLPDVVFPEIEDPITWQLAFFLPFEVVEKYLGVVAPLSAGKAGEYWGMNAFKCSEESSHPHWASWQPCSGFNFHQPSEFGYLVFE